MSRRQSQKQRRLNADKLATAWLKQANWLVRTMTDLHEVPTAHGKAWRRKMILYYNRKYVDLRESTPRRCVPRAKQIDAIIDELLAAYDEL